MGASLVVNGVLAWIGYSKPEIKALRAGGLI